MGYRILATIYKYKLEVICIVIDDMYDTCLWDLCLI